MLDLPVTHPPLTCGQGLGRDLCSDLLCAALIRGLQKARFILPSLAFVPCRATGGVSLPGRERGGALNFHGNKSVTKAEHRALPLAAAREEPPGPALQLRDQAGMPGRAESLTGGVCVAMVAPAVLSETSFVPPECGFSPQGALRQKGGRKEGA